MDEETVEEFIERRIEEKLYLIDMMIIHDHFYGVPVGPTLSMIRPNTSWGCYAIGRAKIQAAGQRPIDYMCDQGYVGYI